MGDGAKGTNHASRTLIQLPRIFTSFSCNFLHIQCLATRILRIIQQSLDTMANQPYTPKPVTDIFTADTDIDRRQCKREVPMRVLALGLGRTGTACNSCIPKVHLRDANAAQHSVPPFKSSVSQTHTT
jgi:hypothetical protein